MKYLSFLLLAFFIISCSSDPCEEVICVNGACDDGTCACDDGFIGPQCDQIDLLGTYYQSSVMSDPNTNCSQAYLDYNPSLREEALCDALGCGSFLYTFNSDMTLKRKIIRYEDSSSGPLVERFDSVTEGTYTIEGNTITITDGLDKGRVLTFDKYVLTAYSSFWQDCFAYRTWTKRKE